MTPWRLLFMGSDAIALPMLEALAGDRRVLLVGAYTQPDRPSGRGQKLAPNAIKLGFQARGLPVWQPEALGEAEHAHLLSLRLDLTLVMAYGHLLRQAAIDAPAAGTLNLHTSLLPRYRGASPVQTALVRGERETGVTLMRMVKRLDAGAILDAERVPIEPLDTAETLLPRMAAACVPLLRRHLDAWSAGTLRETPQEEAAATSCRRLSKEDGALDFTAPASALAARINGLFPWPACGVTVGETPLKLGLADVASDGDDATNAPPGEILGADPHGVLVATGRGILRLRRLQRPGGKLLPAAEFLRGFPLPPGTRLPSSAMTVL